MADDKEENVKSRPSSPRLLACLAAWIALLALMIGLLALSEPVLAQGPIEVGGPITTPTHWAVTEWPYVVTATLSIEAGGSLTIDPGVEVRFQAGTALHVVDGPLLALGDPAQPVSFTADTLAPGRGFWGGVVYATDAPPSELRHCIIEYATTGLTTDVTQNQIVDGCTLRHNGDGGDWSTGGAIDSAGDALSLTDNLIYDNEVGLHLRKSFNDVITGNQISGNNGYGIAFIADLAPAGDENLIAENEIHHNGGFGIGILGESTSNDGDDNVFRDNLIYGHVAGGGYPGHGLYLRFGSNNSVTGNRIWDNAGHGVRFDGQAGLDFSHNVVRGNVLDGLAYGASNGTPTALHGNVLCSNAGYQMESAWPSTLPAEGNWFGTNTPASGIEVVGNVLFTPWISLAVAVDPPLLPADGSSTAEMTVTMTGGGYAVPDGYTVTLTASQGTISPPVLALVNGQGTATYTAGTVSTTVDITVADGCASFVFSEALTVEAHLDLAVVKDDGMGVALVLEPAKTYVITYTFAYSNAGLVDAAASTLTDTLPAGSRVYDAGGWTCAAGICTYAGGPLAVGARAAAPPLVVEVLECGDLVNEVTIGSPGADYDLSNNTSVVTSTLACLPDLAVVKDDQVGPTVQAGHWLLPQMTLEAQQRPCVNPGDRIVYSILYANTGLVTATEVVLTETLPENAHHVGTDWDCLGRTCTYELGSVAPGAGGEVFLSVDVDAVPALALVVNKVEIGGLEEDLYPFDNVAYEDAPICGLITGDLYLPLVLRNYNANPPQPPTPTPTPPPPPEEAFVSDVAVNPETGLVYVASPQSDAVFVVDPAGVGSVLTTVPVGDHPLGLAVVTTTNKIYAANLNSWDVTPIRGSDHAALPPIYAGAQACKVTADSAAGRVYVANHLESDNGAAAIDSQTDTRLYWYSRLHATQGRYGIDVDPEGGKLFIAARDAGLVAIQDIAAYDQDPYMFKPQDPARVLFLVAFNPTTGHLFVTAPDDNLVLAIDPYNIQWGRGQWVTYRGQPLFLLNRINAGWIREIPVGLGAEEGITVNPVTGYVYVTNGGSDTVSVLQDDANPLNIHWVQTIDVGEVPQGVAVDVKTNTIYVGNAGSRTLSVIDGGTHTVVKTIPLE